MVETELDESYFRFFRLDLRSLGLWQRISLIFWLILRSNFTKKVLRVSSFSNLVPVRLFAVFLEGKGRSDSLHERFTDHLQMIL